MNETPWAALMAAAAPRAASIWSSASLGTFLHEYENGAETARRVSARIRGGAEDARTHLTVAPQVDVCADIW